MKTKLFYFLLGVIISGTVTAIAVTSINATDVTYTDRNNNEIRLNQALDNVYSSLNNKITLNTFGQMIENHLFTTQKNTNQTASLSLNKGKYLIVTGQLLSAAYSSKVSGTFDDFEVSLTCQDCQINKLFLKSYRRTGTATYSSTSAYIYQSDQVGLYYVDVPNNSETLTVTHINSSNNNVNPVTIFLNAIPISE